MRHDIDFDVVAARVIAELEAEEGVRATYFFLIRTEHYNFLLPESTAAVERILGLGHHLGLHFDCAAYPPQFDRPQLAAACHKEAALLSKYFGTAVEIVSYHRPSSIVLTGDPELSAPLPHTYMARFTKEMRYCSDSRGEWRYGDPRMTPEYAAGLPMHILIHPIWWSHSRRQNTEVLDGWLKSRIASLEDSVAANCTVYQKRETAQ